MTLATNREAALRVLPVVVAHVECLRDSTPFVSPDVDRDREACFLQDKHSESTRKSSSEKGVNLGARGRQRLFLLFVCKPVQPRGAFQTAPWQSLCQIPASQ
uniref:Uncharacterized protein n=1 Tax=Entomoneis paludosa TaxID=265537 RepID=A0A7S2YDL0_9STRA